MKKTKKEYRIDDTMMTEQEFKNFVFGTGKVVSVKDESALKSALEKGEYVIGVGYQPFCLKYVFQYSDGKLNLYRFEEGEHPEPLNIQLVLWNEMYWPLESFCKYLIRIYDDLLINPTKDMLNLDGIKKSADYSDKEYCAYGVLADKRNCETCSMTHYFQDCNGNPIHSKDDE